VKFAIFICSHGRPECTTVDALRNAGYRGKIYILLDDEDDRYKEYYRLEDERTQVIIFHKQYFVDNSDIGVSAVKAKRKVILYAKQACEEFAKFQKLDVFGIADDDFLGFRYRYPEDGKLKSATVSTGLDAVFENYSQFLVDNNLCMTSVATNQMFMGGELDAERISGFRVPYSFVFRNTAIPFEWKSELFEDVISATLKTQQGYFMMQMPFMQLNLKPLYAGADGGMTEAYQSVDFIKKLFPVVQYLPSCTKIATTSNSVSYRLMKDNAFPKVVSSKYKKDCKPKECVI